MKTKTLMLILGLLFFVGTLGGFYWLWSSSNNIANNYIVPENLQTVEIGSIENDATTMLNGLEKNSDMPIPVPASKMGRTNPFDAAK